MAINGLVDSETGMHVDPDSRYAPPESVVTLSPDSSTRNIIQATGDHIGLIIKAIVDQTVPLQQWQDYTGTPIASVNPDGTFTVGLYILPYADGTAGQYLATDGQGTVGWTTNPGLVNTSDPLYGNLGILGSFAPGVNRNILLGTNSSVDSGDYSVVVGCYASVDGAANVCIGESSQCAGANGSANSVVVGQATLIANSNKSIYVGASADVTGNSNIGLGYDNSITCDSSVVAGEANTITGDANIIIGDSNTVTHTGCIFIGASSVTSDDNNLLRIGTLVSGIMTGNEVDSCFTVDGTINSQYDVVVLNTSNGYFIGDPDVDGTWKIAINGDGDLVMEKRESGSYITKTTIGA